MATSDLGDEIALRNRRAGTVLAVLAVMVLGGIVYYWWTRPPQMGVDDQVFHTVDALYTAVRSKDLRRLGQCADRLQTYREAGKLPSQASDYLDGVIAKARDGRWDSAVERLYTFMLAQRREGVLTASKPSTSPIRVARRS